VSAARAARLARCAGVVAGIATFALGSCARAERDAAPYSPSRLWDGTTPDFRGIWQVRDTAYVNIEGHSGEGDIAASPGIVVDPPDGKIPYTPEALARATSAARTWWRSRAGVSSPDVPCRTSSSRPRA
jgi:hypothetical protein